MVGLPPACPCLCGCRDELFRQSLSRLREQVVKANTLVREANFLAEEMSTLTDYQVTLQIPAANLSTNRKVGMDLEVGWKRAGRGETLTRLCFCAAGVHSERACHPGEEEREGDPGVEH